VVWWRYMSDNLDIPEIILASTSPRRQMLLRQVNIPFRVIPPVVDEVSPIGDDFARIVVINAEAKAASVLDQVNGQAILGADTLVELNGRPLGKPVNRDDARRMLNELSGQDHSVHTGITLIDAETGAHYCDNEITRVYFRNLRRIEIDAYIESGEPMDKAGSYGIQGRGALFIYRVEGCFFNVMGLPLSKLWEILLKRKQDCRG